MKEVQVAAVNGPPMNARLIQNLSLPVQPNSIASSSQEEIRNEALSKAQLNHSKRSDSSEITVENNVAQEKQPQQQTQPTTQQQPQSPAYTTATAQHQTPLPTTPTQAVQIAGNSTATAPPSTPLPPTPATSTQSRPVPPSAPKPAVGVAVASPGQDPEKERFLEVVNRVVVFSEEYGSNPGAYLGNRTRISEVLGFVKELDKFLSFPTPQVPALLKQTKGLLLLYVSKGKALYAQEDAQTKGEFEETRAQFKTTLEQLKTVLTSADPAAQARSLIKQNNFTEAIEFISKQPDLNTNAKLLFLRSKAYRGKGDKTMAIADIQSARKVDASTPKFAFHEADCWLDVHEVDKARLALTQGRKILTEKPVGYYREVELRVQELEDIQQNKRKIDSIPNFINQEATKDSTRINNFNLILFGASGSGKSSFVNTVSRVLHPDAESWQIAQTQASTGESTVAFGQYDIAPGLMVFDTRGLIQWEAKELEQVKMQLGAKKRIAKTGVEVKQRELNFFDKITRKDKNTVFDSKATAKVTLGNKPHFIILVVSTAAPFPHQIDNIVSIATDSDIGDVEKIRNEILQLYNSRDENIAHKIMTIENYHQKNDGSWTERSTRIEAQTLRILRIAQNRAEEFVHNQRLIITGKKRLGSKIFKKK